MELNFLGRFEAMLDGVPVTGFTSDKIRALLAYLAVEGGQPHRREALAGLLWPDYPDSDALVSLRQAIYKLRLELGGNREAGTGRQEPGSGTQEPLPTPNSQLPTPFLLVTPQSVQLEANSYRLDVEEFRALVDACRSHRHRKNQHCSTCHTRFLKAAHLYRGDLLAGFLLEDSQAFDEWLVLKREALRRDALEVFENLATYHESRTDYGKALPYVYRQLEMEPWREEAHRRAMRLLALEGQRSAAIAQYETCRRVLREEFGIEPEAQTSALYERIKTGDQETTDDGRRTTSIPHNLPQQLTPFIGREEELARIVELLDSPDYRLISLVGLGGVGKTRLALRAAQEQVGTFDDGVRYVPLAAVGRADLMASSIAQAIGLRFGGSEQPGAQLLEHLRDREMLLVLDNFEHLLGAPGGPPGDPGDPPGPPGNPGNNEGGAPDDENQKAGGTDILVSILRNAAKVTMLVTSRERLGLQAEHIVDVSGFPVPSSIVYTPDALEELTQSSAVRLFMERAQRIQSGFALSPENAQGVLDICRLVEGLPLGIVLAAAWVRHFPTARIARSIRDNLDFLKSSPRDASAQHSSLRAAFNHSWNLLSEDEQQVLRKLSVFRGGWDEDAAEKVAGAPVYSLFSLVDKSLLRRDASGRFNIHEVVRQYAAEQLQAALGEQSETHAAHAAYFLDFAEQASEMLWGSETETWLTRLDREHNNLRASLEWASLGLEGYKVTRLESSQPSTFQPSNLVTFQRLSGALWRFWYLRGHYKEGREHLMAAISSLRDSETGPVYAARIYHGAGVLSVVQGDPVTATELLEESVQLYRQVGNKARMAAALNAAGVAAHDQGDYVRAAALYSESLTVNREMGDKLGMLLALNNWGNVAREQGEYERAQSLFTESLALGQQIGDNRGIALSLQSMGIVAWYQEDFTSAASLLQQSLKLHHELGDRLGMSNSLEVLGRVAASQSETDPSRAEDAARFWGAAAALREAIGSPLPPADRADHEGSVALARETLDREAFEKAWARGRTAPIGEIVAYALGKA